MDSFAQCPERPHVMYPVILFGPTLLSQNRTVPNGLWLSLPVSRL